MQQPRVLCVPALLAAVAVAVAACAWSVRGADIDGGPLIHVNQMAYTPGLPKLALLVSSSQTPFAYEVVNGDGAVVACGHTQPVPGIDRPSNDSVHRLDFSFFDTPGDGYTLRVPALGAVSYPFSISSAAIKRLRQDALHFFYHQRSGVAIESRFVPDSRYARPAGHVNVAPNTGDFNVGCRDETPCSYTLDVQGGWYDAGDQGKYLVNGGLAVGLLLNTYERALSRQRAAAWGDGTVDGDKLPSTLLIPESGNGIPDILDEAKWELEFMLRMRVPVGQELAGMAHHKIHDTHWTGLPTRPEQDTEPRKLAPPSTAATLNLVAAAAMGARLFRPFNASFADALLAAARTSYVAAKAHPDLLAPASDGTGGGAYEDYSVSDEFYWAACELFVTTGEDAYLQDVRSSAFFTTPGLSFKTGNAPLDWSWVGGFGDLSLVTSPASRLPDADKAAIRSAIVSFADYQLDNVAAGAYAVPHAFDYYWGSSGSVGDNGLMLGLAFDYTGKREYAEAAFAAIDYFFGRNPLNLAYIAGYGSSHSVHNLHHRFWAHELDAALPSPPPGTVSGGPNQEVQDPVMVDKFGAKGGCSPQKCHLDEIMSYSTNEECLNWNAPVVALAGWAAEFINDGHSFSYSLPTGASLSCTSA